MTPDPVATPVEGWRAWRVNPHDLYGLLPLYKFTPLRPGMRAFCDVVHTRPADRKNAADGTAAWFDLHPEGFPDFNCTCGYWLLKDAPRRWYTTPSATDTVFGTAIGWGRIIEHEEGWRCEYIKPQTLIIHPMHKDRIPDLSARYGCEFQISEHPTTQEYRDRIRDAFMQTAKSAGEFTAALGRLTITVNNINVDVFVKEHRVDFDKDGTPIHILVWEEM